MLVSEGRAAELKTWVTKKLEDISDADADVLADYVLALVRHDTPESDLRRSVILNLEDFLKGNTAAFVDELFKALKAQPKPPMINPAGPKFIPSTASAANVPFATLPHTHTQGSLAADGSRKRPFHSVQGPTSPTRHRGRNDRPMKQVRGGGAPVRGPGVRVAKENQHPSRNGMPFDPQQAAAALWTLESMGFPLPQLSLDPGAFSGNMSGPARRGKGKSKGKSRCKDYDTVGICQRGAHCPYLHDANQIIMPLGDDFPLPTPASNGHSVGGLDQTQKGVAGRGKSKAQRGRADPSTYRPWNDPSQSSVIVLNIPDEHLNEDSVAEFFTTFGLIQEVRMLPERRQAIVKYESHEAAVAAYESPKVVFDNRFVKVYWYNPRKNHSEDGSSQEAATFDREAFERGLEVAQKLFEERKALKEATDTKVAEIQQQREEVERKREAERQRLLEKIRERRPLDDSAGDDAKSSTEVLRAKLKMLEEEAEILGLHPEPWTSEASGYTRGRGAYRARGSGFGGPSFRGSVRGRAGGGYRGGLPGGGAYNLDNRPRTVKVEGVEFDTDKDEALRQYLINVGEFTSIEPDPSGTAQIITFKDRLTAERFFYASRTVPGVGKLEFTWVRDEPPSSHKMGVTKAASRGGTGIDDEDMANGSDDDANAENENEREHGERYSARNNDETADMDYDVAEDEER